MCLWWFLLIPHCRATRSSLSDYQTVVSYTLSMCATIELTQFHVFISVCAHGCAGMDQNISTNHSLPSFGRQGLSLNLQLANKAVWSISAWDAPLGCSWGLLCCSGIAGTWLFTWGLGISTKSTCLHNKHISTAHTCISKSTDQTNKQNPKFVLSLFSTHLVSYFSIDQLKIGK